MKTDNFVAMLAADGAQIEPGFAQSLRIFMPALVLAVFCVFFATIGARPNLFTVKILVIVCMKAAVAAALTFSAWLILRDVARIERALPAGPSGDRQAGAKRAWLLLAPGLFLLFLFVEFVVAGPQGWQSRMLGENGLRCLSFVSLLAAIPFAGFLFALTRGTSASPSLTGALAGLASAGIGAGVYSLSCTEDSALFFGLWYGLASLGMALLGAACGRRLLRW